MSRLKATIRYGYVPFMLLGLNTAGNVLVSGGYSYFWLAAVLAIAFIAAYFSERFLPWYDEWNHGHGDEASNAWHTLIYESNSIQAMTLIPVVIWLFPFQGFWPTSWPLALQLLLAVLVADFGFTMVHYLSHRLPLLWRLHAVHHGVSRLCGFNGLVRHPLHQSLDTIVGTAPLVILGMPLDVAVLLGLAISLQLIVQHSNVAYELGPFRNHLSIGRIHHLHHVSWGKEGDCNFALFFTVWDRLLGTFHPEPPRPIEAHDLGIDDVPQFPKSYLRQLVFPFVYKPGEGLPAKWTDRGMAGTVRQGPAQHGGPRRHAAGATQPAE